MNRFGSFVRKEFAHIARDRWTMVILLLLPVVMLVLFGYAITTDELTPVLGSVTADSPSVSSGTCTG